MNRIRIGVDLFLLTSILLLALASCRSPSLAEQCATAFPSTHSVEVREQTVTDTILLPSHIVEYLDTTICPPGLPDTLRVIETKLVTMPGDTIIRDVICTDTVIIQRDAALIQSLRGENQARQIRIQSLENRVYGRNIYLVLASVLAFVFGLMALFKN